MAAASFSNRVTRDALRPMFTVSTALAWLGHCCVEHCSAPIDSLAARIWFVPENGVVGPPPRGNVVLFDFDNDAPAREYLPVVHAINRCAARDGVRFGARRATTTRNPNACLTPVAELRQTALPQGDRRAAPALTDRNGLDPATTPSHFYAGAGPLATGLARPAAAGDIGPPTPTSVRLQIDYVRQHIIVSGELDCASTHIMSDATRTLLETHPGDSSIDLAGVSFLDAAGIGTLVDCANQLNSIGATLAIVGVRPKLRHIFDILNLTAMLSD
jgi:anti-anti-sigma factor